MNEMPVHNIKDMGCDTERKEYGSVSIRSLHQEQTLFFSFVFFMEYFYVSVSSGTKKMLLRYGLLFCGFHSKVEKVMLVLAYL